MTNPNDPVHSTIVDLNPTGHLTKREYFAAMAFSGMDLGDALIAELNKDGK